MTCSTDDLDPCSYYTIKATAFSGEVVTYKYCDKNAVVMAAKAFYPFTLEVEKMTSYSQQGEDLVVADYFKDSVGKKPFRVLEIGAYHPITFSNSRKFIESGWHAVLIDASPWAIEALVKEYGENEAVTIINAAVAINDDKLLRMKLTPDGVSSSDPAVLSAWAEQGGYVGWAYVATLRPERISLQFGHFDFISVDIEGGSVPLAVHCMLELNWRPRVWCIEHDNRTVELMNVAQTKGYRMVHLNQTNAVLAS